MFFFYLITKKKKIQAKRIKRADTQNLANNDIGKIRNWHQKNDKHNGQRKKKKDV